MSIEELKADAAEFAALLEKSQRARIKGVLTQAKAEVEREIVNLEIKARLVAERSGEAAAREPKRYLHELTDYAWDQSAKFVKLFITLNGVQNCSEEDVTLELSPKTLQMHVRNLNGKDYGLSVNNLLHNINVKESYRKLKTDLVAIYLKKADEGQDWDVLTAIQKRLKQKQETDMAKDSDTTPESTLVNLMRKMYTEGDSKTKQMIAKAWTESQDKARPGGAAAGLSELASDL